MSKYAPLGEFLRKRATEHVPMRFDEIERITGVKLPPRAQLYRAWWSNNPSNNVMTRVWLDAGYRTEQVDMAQRKLVFRRTSKERTMPKDEPAASEKQHPLIGALKGFVQIAPGTDLAQPADPEWGHVTE